MHKFYQAVLTSINHSYKTFCTILKKEFPLQNSSFTQPKKLKILSNSGLAKKLAKHNVISVFDLLFFYSSHNDITMAKMIRQWWKLTLQLKVVFYCALVVTKSFLKILTYLIDLS